MRRGITVEVSATGYRKTHSDISAELLKASPEQKRITVYVDPDNSQKMDLELRLLTERLEQIRAQSIIFGDLLQQASLYARSVRDARDGAQALDSDADRTIEALRSAALWCSQSAAAARAMEQRQQQAAQMEAAVAKSLTEAERLAQRCAMPADAATAKRLHLEAIRMLGRIGVLEKEARESSVTLTKQAAALQDAQGIHASISSRLAGVDRALEAARVAVQRATGLVEQARTDRATYLSLASTFNPDLAKAELNYQRLSRNGTDPSMAAVRARLEAIAKEFDSIRVPPSVVGVSDRAAEARADLATAEAARRRVETVLTDFKLAGCRIETGESATAAISLATTNASSEVLLSADLPSRVDQCQLRSGACAQQGQAIKQLLTDGGIDEARTRIDAAKRQGCSVADLENDFATYKDIRDAATYIHALNEACRFQDAVQWSGQLPSFASSAAIVAREMRNSVTGLSAQNNVTRSLQQAADAARREDYAGADAALKRAQTDASGIACLLNETALARAALKLPVPGTAPGTRPAAGGGGTLTSQVTVTPNRRDDGFSGSYVDHRYTSTGGQLESRIPQYDGSGYTSRTYLHYEFSGVPASLTPGQKYVIQATGGIEYTPKDGGDGMVFGSGVEVFGDADVKGQAAHRGGMPYEYLPGTIEITVRPNAKNVEIRLVGAGTGAIATWKYKN
jgi:hypothetical protein